MLSMWKLLSATLLLSSVLYGETTSEKIEDFLLDKFEENSRIENVHVRVEEKVPLEDIKGWDGYIVSVKATIKQPVKKQIKQKMIWFSNGTMITKELVNMDTGRDLLQQVKPKFKAAYYAKENLVYGNANAKHKIAFFSDPLCPFCKGFVPGALKELKKEPKKFAVYYYHLPLERIHPASVHIVKMMTAAQLQGVKDVIIKTYNIKVNPREKNVQKILDAFNKAVGTKLTMKDINAPVVLKHVKKDFNIATDLLVGGTPTVYLDGKYDKKRNSYKKVK